MDKSEQWEVYQAIDGTLDTVGGQFDIVTFLADGLVIESGGQTFHIPYSEAAAWKSPSDIPLKATRTIVLYQLGDRV